MQVKVEVHKLERSDELGALLVTLNLANFISLLVHS
jgi:hypothetical protein